MSKEGFRAQLEHIINCESMENGCNTPDFILAEYLKDCLEAFDKATNRREEWYGRGKQTLATGGTGLNPLDPMTAFDFDALNSLRKDSNY